EEDRDRRPHLRCAPSELLGAVPQRKDGLRRLVSTVPWSISTTRHVQLWDRRRDPRPSVHEQRLPWHGVQGGGAILDAISLLQHRLLWRVPQEHQAAMLGRAKPGLGDRL